MNFMTYTQECLEKFQELPNLAKEKIGGAETFNVITELEKKYKVSLSFLIVLLAIGELGDEDIYDYVTARYQLEPAFAKTLSQEIKSKILDPFLVNLREIWGLTPENPIPDLRNSEDNEKMILEIFSNQLVKTLKINKFDDLHKLNILIFKILHDNDNFENKIIEILYNSPDKLTSHRLVSIDRKVEPTVANWLKDFIKQNGSKLFDELSLEQYLVNSENARELEPEEKNLVRKLLKLYRNLVFFPESMEGIPLEQWEIFSVDYQPENQSSGIRDVLATPAETAPGEALTKQLIELEETLKNYSPSSLEYKALSQEISRLKRGSLKIAQQQSSLRK